MYRRPASSASLSSLPAAGEALPRGRQQIVITSIPYAVNKADIVAQIAEEIVTRKLPQVVDVRDESTTDIRIVLELKPDAAPEAAMAYVYKHSALQTNFNVNLTCLLPSQPSKIRSSKKAFSRSR